MAHTCITLALGLALAGCGAATNATGGSAATATTPAMATDTSTTQSTSPQPTPLPTGTFTTYTNTTYGYSTSYPQNWDIVGADPTAQSFMVFNYDPQTYQQSTSAPPLLKIEIDAAPNPSNLAPLDLFKQSLSGPGQPAATIQSSQTATLAGRSAERIVWTSAASRALTITYLVPHGATTLFISQTNAENGQPSPVFAQMLASLTISGA